MANNINLQNDPVLTTLFRGYMPQESQYIQNQILPRIDVGSSNGDIPSVTTTANSFLKVHGDLMASTSGTPEIAVSLTKGTGWSTDRHGLKIMVTKKDGQQFDNSDWRAGMTKAESMYTRMLKNVQLLIREYSLASALFNTSTFTNNVTLAGGDQWSAGSTSDPAAVCDAAKRAVRSATGSIINTMVTSWEVMQYLIRHPLLKKTIGTAGDGTVPVKNLTYEQVAQALDIDKIIVGSVMYDSAMLGQTSSLANVWGKYALFTYINPNPQPDMFQRSLGYQFMLDDYVVDSYEPEDPKFVKYVRYDAEYDDVILDEKAGYLVAGAVA
jgi:hypothetical protein